MSIKSIKINNLLSYNELYINEIRELNCVIGKNNSGKSNLLKLLRFFYQKIEGRKVLTPSLNSNYSSFGSITIEY
ncbi:ATP-binding protein, partial [Lelliottia amnigena]